MSDTLSLTAVNQLDPNHIDQLFDLFEREWWTKGRTRDSIETMLAGSDAVVGLIEPDIGRLVGFARAITDGVYKALIFDVIVVPDHRGKGTGRMLMERLLAHPQLHGVRHKELYCRPDMVDFYRRWGFSDRVGGVSLMRRDDGD